ncbi:MAG: 1-acyl-sn-glycerol-3-phosphate acyltransferase [Spirochaetes bacterium]|nr:1-acyl-sn-glycerol-3-phosphate acyltransferase [Spirochaetota bacterium]MBU1080175.1 1-acyl-sn-glycerol-3-phosphate acyltransferase [Spirochaetota bacterium]
MEDTIEGDSYDTPDGIKRYASEYLMLGSRWSPYSKFFEVMFQSRRLALRGLYDDEAWARSSIEILRRLERCGAKLHISGLDNVRALSRPAVFISNHMSTFETLLLPGIINPIRPCTYVVKEKLLNGLIWGPIMRSRDPISVTRTDARKDLEAVMQGGAERLAKGRSIIIFPQGTRTDAFSRAGFNSLGVKLASRAGVPVVAVAVKTDYWGNSPLFRGFGPVRRDRPVMIQFAPAMAVSGRGKAEHEAVLDFIEGRLREWGGQMAETAVD